MTKMQDAAHEIARERLSNRADDLVEAALDRVTGGITVTKVTDTSSSTVVRDAVLGGPTVKID
jgi:hypothetical protein